MPNTKTKENSVSPAALLADVTSNSAVVDSTFVPAFIPRNTAAIKKVFKDLKAHAIIDEDNQANDVNAFATVALPVIREMSEAGKIIIIDTVRTVMFSAVGYETNTKAKGYRTIINRTQRGIQAAMLVYTAEQNAKSNYRLDKNGQLQAFQNELKSTCVYRDDNGGVIDNKADNTLDHNPNAHEWTNVPQGSFSAQMIKCGLAEGKGADERSQDALEKQSGKHTTMRGMADKLSGTTTNGKPLSFAGLSEQERVDLTDLIDALFCPKVGKFKDYLDAAQLDQITSEIDRIYV